MKLSIVITTRNRPHLIVPTVRTTLKNIRNKETSIVVMHDADDEKTAGVKPQLERMGARVITVPRPKSFGTKFNIGVASEPGDVYLAMVDYAPNVTEGFDQKILDASTLYPDGHAVMYNWWQNLSFCPTNAVTHKLVEKLGGIYPELYPYWWIDHHLINLARMIDRCVFVDIHVDVTARQEKPDKPWTTNKRETWFWALLFDSLAGEYMLQARSIIESPDFDETPARKKVLINNLPWIMHHSAMVNSYARNDLGGDFTTDDWYRGVKATGLAKLKEVLSPAQFKEYEALQARLNEQVNAMTKAAA